MLTRRIGERVRIGEHMLRVVAVRGPRVRLELEGGKWDGRWIGPGDKPMLVGEAEIFVLERPSERRVALSILAAADVKIMREELLRTAQG